MTYKRIGSGMMIGLMISLVIVWFIPSMPVIPSVNALPPAGTRAIVGLFNEARKTNALITSSIGPSTTFVMDINITAGGSASAINGIDFNITYAVSALTVVGSAVIGPGCPSTQCMFTTFSPLANVTNNVGTNGIGSMHLAGIVNGAPFQGDGVMFRITLRTTATTGATVIHINKNSAVLNPSQIQYFPIDGYLDNKAAPTADYRIGLNMTARSLNRPISGSVARPVTATLTTLAGTVPSTRVQTLALPLNIASPDVSCTPTCTSTVTITANGGASGGPTTAPSGTFKLAVIGNVTVGSIGQLIKVSWLTLTIVPPSPPTYTFTTTSPTSFTAELGATTFIQLTGTLTGGSNDSISFSSNCATKLSTTGGDCAFKPSIVTNWGQSSPATSQVNVTTNPSSGVTGTFMFNVTSLTTGTYSETTVSHFIQFTITIIKTHDISAEGTFSATRSFGYNGIALTGSNQLRLNFTVSNLGTVAETFNVNVTAKAVLSVDSKLLFNDANSNGQWDPGETIIYDVDASFTYTTGDIIVTGTAPAIGTFLTQDFNLRFFDGFLTGKWKSGDAVIYDCQKLTVSCDRPGDGNQLYDATDIVPAGQTGITIPSTGILLATGTVTNLPAGSPPTNQAPQSLQWDPSTLPIGNWRIGGAAVPVAGELVVGNNFPTPFFGFQQRHRGDVNADCVVNVLDFSKVGGVLGKKRTDTGYIAEADGNNDGVINVLDLTAVSGVINQPSPVGAC